MSQRLVLSIEISNEDDTEWVRNKLVPLVEDALEDPEGEIEPRIEGKVELGWEIEETGELTG